MITEKPFNYYLQNLKSINADERVRNIRSPHIEDNRRENWLSRYCELRAYKSKNMLETPNKESFENFRRILH